MSGAPPMTSTALPSTSSTILRPVAEGTRIIVPRASGVLPDHRRRGVVSSGRRALHDLPLMLTSGIIEERKRFLQSLVDRVVVKPDEHLAGACLHFPRKREPIDREPQWYGQGALRCSHAEAGMTRRFIQVAATLAFLHPGPAAAQDRIFTLAGGGPHGLPATQAYLYNYDVVVDGAGNIYIPSVSRIFKVDPAGWLTVHAGNNVPGFSGDGRHATLAQLNDPRGVVFDTSRNLLVADTANHRIRRIDARSGIITTIAGAGTATTGGDGGPALDAGLASPHGVAVGPDGSIFVSQPAANRVRRIDPLTGIISTFAGTGAPGFSGDGGPAAGAQLNSPHHLDVDTGGNLLIADVKNYRIRRVDAATGSISTVAGSGAYGTSGDGGPALAAAFERAAGLVVDSSGNIFITDYHSNYGEAWGGRVRRVDAVTGVITGHAGGLDAPEGIALDAAGNPFIADLGSGCFYGCGIMGIRKVPAGTQILETVAGGDGSSPNGDGGPAVDAVVYKPFGMDVDAAGNVFFVQGDYNTVRRVSAASGEISTVAGGVDGGYFCGDGGPATGACLRQPADVSVDSNGNLYIADTGNHRIRKVNSSTGNITTIAGDGTTSFLSSPNAVTVDASGNVFIADTYHNRVRRLSGGVLTTVAGNGLAGFSGDGGPATMAKLNQPRDLALDAAGNLFIVDRPRVRRVDALTGIIDTVAGNGTFGLSGDGGPAVNAAMAPSGIDVDADGNLLILEEGNRIRLVDAATGIITTLAGNGGTGTSPDGTLAKFALVHFEYWNIGIAFHPMDGYVFSDMRNGLIRHVMTRDLASGSVPDGSLDPNQAMDITLAADGRITLSWQPSCLAGDTDYVVYHGAIGSFDDPVPLLCSTAGLTTASIEPPPSSSWFLIAPRNGLREGSYGLGGDSAQRPQGAVACLDRMISPACGP